MKYVLKFDLIVILTLTPIIIDLKSTLKRDEKIISELHETNDVYAEKEVEN